jgi:hypothetical protein
MILSNSSFVVSEYCKSSFREILSDLKEWNWWIIFLSIVSLIRTKPAVSFISSAPEPVLSYHPTVFADF